MDVIQALFWMAVGAALVMVAFSVSMFFQLREWQKRRKRLIKELSLTIHDGHGRIVSKTE